MYPVHSLHHFWLENHFPVRVCVCCITQRVTEAAPRNALQERNAKGNISKLPFKAYFPSPQNWGRHGHLWGFCFVLMVWSPAWPQTHYVVENDPEFLIPKFPLPWGKLRLQDFVTTLSRVTCYLLNIIHISTKMSPQKVLSCQPQWCKHVIPAPGKRQVNSVSLRPAWSTEQSSRAISWDPVLSWPAYVSSIHLLATLLPFCSSQHLVRT